jgi:hypothetical protein
MVSDGRQFHHLLERHAREVRAWRRIEMRNGAEAAPLPVLGAIDESVPGGIAKDVAAGAVQVFRGEDGTRVVRSLEQVTACVVAAVESHRVEALEALHPAVQLFWFGSHDEVEVVPEEAPGEELPLVSLDDVIEKVKEQVTVSDVEKQPATAIPGGRDEMQVARRPDARRVRHC